MGPLLVFAALGLSNSLLGNQLHVFERAAAAEIRSKLQGENPFVQVKVDPDLVGILWGAVDKATIKARDFSVEAIPLYVEPNRSRAGRCGNLTLDFENFSVRGLRVQRLYAEIPACRYDRGLALSKKRFRLSRSGSGKGVVSVQEADLANYILRKFHEIKSVSVKVDRGVVWVEGYGEFLIIKTNFAVIADLVPSDGTKLVLSNAKVWFDWRKADTFATETLLKTLNPVVDFDKDLGLLDAVFVEKVKLENGVIQAFAKIKVPSLPPGIPPTILP